MLPLHFPTAYFIAGVLYLIMSLAVWFMLRRQDVLGNTLWCLGGLAFGLSLIFLGLREQWPEWITYGLAMYLLILGPLLRASALRQELGRPIAVAWILLAALVFTLGFLLLHVVVQHPIFRFTWASLATAAAFFWLAGLAWDTHRRDNSVSAQWIFASYLLLASLLMLRLPAVWLGLGLPTAMTSDPLSAVLIFLAVLTAIVGNIGFLGIFIERMNRLALESAKHQARQEEAARLSDQIAQLDRRRSVGEIAASLAHELSQPLTNIYLITDRIEMALHERKDESLRTFFQDLNRNTQKAGDILGRIRAFIQAKGSLFERVELSQVANDVSALVRDLAFNESVDLQVFVPNPSVAVMADPVQLSQILMNVLRNAIEATQGQAVRQLHVRVWREGDVAHITLSDNGPGLSPDSLDQAGCPFFSTKCDGLGLGLSISKSIAQQHGGSLHIGNSPTGGALVSLQLPAVD